MLLNERTYGQTAMTSAATISNTIEGHVGTCVQYLYEFLINGTIRSLLPASKLYYFWPGILTV